MLKPALAAAWMLLAMRAGAQQMVLDLDPAKTTIHWTLAGNVHTVHGTFHLKQGHVAWNPATGAISGDLVVASASGESGNVSRDKRMQKEILESQRFPDITLTPMKVEGQLGPSGHSTLQVSGTFLIHGTSHALTIPIDVTLSGLDAEGTGRFSIPYVAWGLKDPSNFLFKVDKTVEVEIMAAGRLTSR